MGVKYKRARSAAASKGWAKAGFAAAGSTRASRARAAAVAARRSLMRARSAKRRVVRGPRPGASASQSVGAAKFLVSQHKPPPTTPLFRSLRNLGVPVPEWRLFQSTERFHIQPASGHCHWGGVPHQLMQGTVVAVPGTNTDYMPGNCDLFDCARKLVQNVVDNNSSYYRPFPWVSTFEGSFNAAEDGFKQSSTTTQTLDTAFGTSAGSKNHRKWKVAKNKVFVTMENISSLDAFIEEYELTYSQPLLGNEYLTGPTTVADVKPYSLSIGCNVGSDWKSAAAIASGKNAPRVFNSRESIPFYKEVYPDNLLVDKTWDIRRYGLRMAGMMLESYADLGLNHRDSLALMDPTEIYSSTRTSDVATTKRRATIPEVLSHPLNDPCRVFAPGVKNETGFHLRKLPGLIVLKPGASKRVSLPVKSDFGLDIDSFPRSADIEADKTFGLTAAAAYRDIVSLPKRMKIRFFRVRGDMISNKSKLESAGDADYQTGSCRVMFQVMRSFYMQHHFQLDAKTVDPLHAFDDGEDAVIDPALQEAINDETDAPFVVDAVGDKII